ncbi:MAG: helix-turn-helix domain-containing protein [Verrucomicrobia bacterium]|nr:helix-turn-helix domain-containing protein [Verrucomicrobiota bacterium]
MVESVGRRLQQARLAKKLEIEDVAEKTKIRPNRIIDLEADEYAHFPNLMYAKSFLAKYAKFLGVDIQEELDKFLVAGTISVGDYQYLSSGPPQKFVAQPRVQMVKGFRVPPAVVVVLVLIVLVGVPVFSYLALNIPRVAGTNLAANTVKTERSADRAPTAIAQSSADSLQSLTKPSSPDENAGAGAQASPPPEEAMPVASASASQPRIEDGVEVRRALPVNAPESSTAAETPTKASLSTLPDKKLEVRVLKRTYVKVTKDEEDAQPVFDGFAAPDSRPIVVEGKRFWVHVSDKGAVEVRKDGQLILGNSDDIVIN